MPTLIAPQAILKSFIHRVHSVLLVQIAIVNFRVVLHVSHCLIAALLKIFLIRIEPGLDLRVIRNKEALAEVNFHICHEVARTRDQNSVDEKNSDAREIV